MTSPRSYRQKRPIPDGSPAAVHPKELGKMRKRIDVLRWHHVALSKRFLGASNGDIFELDLVFLAVMVRSYSLVDAFIDAFDMWNPIVAAPLVRMQIDNLVRLSYIARAPKADDIAKYVIAGGEFRKLRDNGGKFLTDARLVEHAKPHHPWVEVVYQATSGWVHFSPVHVYAGTQVKPSDNDNELALQMQIPLRPERIPLSAMHELVGAMLTATEQVFGYVEVWEQRKGLPLGQIRTPGSS